MLFHGCVTVCITKNFKELEAQLQQESDSARDTVRSLEDGLNEEKQRREEVEQELLKQKKVGMKFLQTNLCG